MRLPRCCTPHNDKIGVTFPATVMKPPVGRGHIPTLQGLFCLSWRVRMCRLRGACIILVLHKKLEKLFIAPKVRQELHETAFVAFAAKGQRE